jgi:hypothetical protein
MRTVFGETVARLAQQLDARHVGMRWSLTITWTWPDCRWRSASSPVLATSTSNSWRKSARTPLRMRSSSSTKTDARLGGRGGLLGTGADGGLLGSGGATVGFSATGAGAGGAAGRWALSRRASRPRVSTARTCASARRAQPRGLQGGRDVEDPRQWARAAPPPVAGNERMLEQVDQLLGLVGRLPGGRAGAGAGAAAGAAFFAIGVTFETAGLEPGGVTAARGARSRIRQAEAQAVGELDRVAEAIDRILRQRLLDHPVELPCDAVVDDDGSVRPFLEDAMLDLRGRAAERRLAGDELVDDRARLVHSVRARGRIAVELLRRPVVDLVHRPGEQRRHAEVGDLEAPVGREDQVPGLEVAVRAALGVQPAERLEHRAREVPDVAQLRVRALLEQRGDRLALAPFRGRCRPPSRSRPPRSRARSPGAPRAGPCRRTFGTRAGRRHRAACAGRS